MSESSDLDQTLGLAALDSNGTGYEDLPNMKALRKFYQVCEDIFKDKFCPPDPNECHKAAWFIPIHRFLLPFLNFTDWETNLKSRCSVEHYRQGLVRAHLHYGRSQYTLNPALTAFVSGPYTYVRTLQIILVAAWRMIQIDPPIDLELLNNLEADNPEFEDDEVSGTEYAASSQEEHEVDEEEESCASEEQVNVYELAEQVATLNALVDDLQRNNSRVWSRIGALERRTRGLRV